MSLYDAVMPSERVAELGLIVRRLLKKGATDRVAVLVVEGPTDEALLSGHCGHGTRQVFAAGTRDLVERMVVYMRSNPVPGCECVYLTDCDGYGKAPYLRSEPRLLVTEGCDAEADLISLGVAERVTSALIGTDAATLVTEAIAMSLPLSIVRRRAARAGVSMKYRRQRLRLSDLSPQVLEKWCAQTPTEEDVIEHVAAILSWSSEQRRMVVGERLGAAPVFERQGSGKDVIDALYFLTVHRGLLRGRSRIRFEKDIHAGLEPGDFPRWEVGRRLARWQQEHGLVLVPGL